MSLQQRIFYNTIAQSLGKVIAVALGLFSVALLTRHLGEAGFGQYSTVLAFLGVVVVFADLGLYLIVVREISLPAGDPPEGEKARNYKILSNAVGIRLTVATAVLILGAVISLVFPYEAVVKQTMFVGIAAFLFVSLNQVLIGIFQKHLVQYLVVFSEILGRALNLILIYLFIQQALPLPYFVAALTAGNGLQFIATFWLARRYETFGIEFDLGYWKRLLTAAWPLAFAVILNLLYFKTDTVILSVFQPEEAVGIYSLPYKILEVLLAFPAMFVGLTMPLLSAAAFTDWQKFKNIFQRSFDALLLLALPMIVTTLFFSQEIINLIKGPERDYADSPKLLQLLIFAAGIIFLGTLFGYAVVAVNQQKAMIKGYLAAAMVGLFLYFILIPSYSYWGAAIGTLVTELVVMLAAYYFIRQKVNTGLSLRIFVLALPATAGMILFYHFINFQWVLEAILGLTTYFLLLIPFRAVPLEFIKEIVFIKRVP